MTAARLTRRLPLAALAAAAALAAPAARAQSTPAAAAPVAQAATAGLEFKPTLKISGFVQGRYTGLVDRDEKPAIGGSGTSTTSPNGFSIARARLRASGDVVERLGYVVEGDFANSSSSPGAILTDAYARIALPFHEIRVGQQKTQFGYENPEGDTKLLVVNRSLVGDALGREQTGLVAASGSIAGNTRDIGIGVLGAIPVVGGVGVEWAGTIVNGAGPNRSSDDGAAPQKDLWGRAGLAFRGWRSTLRVGASLARGHDVASAGSGAAAVPYGTLFHRAGGDVQLDTPWLFVASELVRGSDSLRARRQLLRAGAYVYAYGKTPWRVGPILRVEGYDPNRDVSGDFRRRTTVGAYYDHVALNARVVVNYERDQSTRRQDDALLVQTQVVF